MRPAAHRYQYPLSQTHVRTGFTAPLFRQDAVLGEFVLNAIGSASGLSILFTATTTGTCAASRAGLLRWSAALRRRRQQQQDYDVRCLRTTSTH